VGIKLLEDVYVPPGVWQDVSDVELIVGWVVGSLKGRGPVAELQLTALKPVVALPVEDPTVAGVTVRNDEMIIDGIGCDAVDTFAANPQVLHDLVADRVDDRHAVDTTHNDGQCIQLG